MEKKIRAIRYRIYPDNAQKELFEKTFGCVRFVYNQLLEQQEAIFKSGGKYMSKFDMNNFVNRTLKAKYPWLKEVDKTALTYSAFALDKSYKAFLNHISNKPKFKDKRRSRKSYSTCISNNNIELLDNSIKLPKVKFVKARIHRKPNADWKLKWATVSQECDGKYFCSLSFEYYAEINSSNIDYSNAVGLDYCVNGLFVDSNGKYCGYPANFRITHNKLNKEQRRLSRKIGGKNGEKKSNNYIKQLNKVRKLHRKINNQLIDHLHKTSYEIANQYDVVCIEDLDLKELQMRHMGMGAFNGKVPLKNGFGLFSEFLKYKLDDRGKILVKIDRWYPSSKICSCCGHQIAMPIQVRHYFCPICKLYANRDTNAAINIKNQGIKIIKESLL